MLIAKEEKTLFLPDLAATAELGRQLGRIAQHGDVLLLHGGLGVGKTTLTQAIAAGLGVPSNQYVSSPSFALLHEYQGRLPLFHLDCYRLAGEEDVEGAGLLEYIGRTGLTVVEWPERLDSLQPAERLDVFLEAVSESGRRCRLEAQGWGKERLAQLHCR
ncbi:tRNA (adenosine(37)-N6)-threonylcarbamoyltransferase complex ATPase subunit type 1 TsaE [Candidatus Electronema sp. PJ]|uniref:tRNA (adenosine(37)-N6)-threonylcarbamoyltransferase complex ATPase subunit type 1 TsaE n=1 Tax=Candidatus Electronema sp. PJ TaxID=3401572 RepID=UPI003AA91060